ACAESGAAHDHDRAMTFEHLEGDGLDRCFRARRAAGVARLRAEHTRQQRDRENRGSTPQHACDPTAPMDEMSIFAGRVRRPYVEARHPLPRGVTVRYLMLVCWDAERMDAPTESAAAETSSEERFPWPDDVQA